MANLKVTITENLSLNGVEQGGSYQNTITGINDVYKRIVTVPADVDTTLVSFKSTVGVADAAMDVNNIEYIRISNLGSTPVNLSLQVDDDDVTAESSATIRLTGGKNFVMGSVSASIGVDDDSNSIVDSALDNVESIICDSSASNATVEIFIAST